MPSFTEHLGFHASALQLRSRRNEMLASNIANAATPNFKARDLDFDTELKRIIKLAIFKLQIILILQVFKRELEKIVYLDFQFIQA